MNSKKYNSRTSKDSRQSLQNLNKEVEELLNPFSNSKNKMNIDLTILETYSKELEKDELNKNKEIKEDNNNIDINKKRINIVELLKRDELAEKYIILPPNNSINDTDKSLKQEKAEDVIPYEKTFDNMMPEKNESIFFLFNNDSKMDEKEVEKMLSGKNELNFGEDPVYIRDEMISEKKLSQEETLKFVKILDSFCQIKSNEPNFLQIMNFGEYLEHINFFSETRNTSNANSGIVQTNENIFGENNLLNLDGLQGNINLLGKKKRNKK